MFLYGMDLMGKALEQTAGSKLQGILSKMTASPVRGLLLGMVITAVIQSSGATTVMAVGFVNSGLMELHQAIGVIMAVDMVFIPAIRTEKPTMILPTPLRRSLSLPSI